VISVVIPALDEEAGIAGAIRFARDALGDCEIVVADGGSDDRTVELAATAGARVVEARGTRADGMNAGAVAASGGVLLFLHADTRLPVGAGDAIDRALREAVGGAFSLGFDSRPRLARLAATLYRPLHRGVYGDQAIFVRREAWAQVGGYRCIPIMEDYDLVQRLRRIGRFVVVSEAVVTSARRQRAHGEVRTFATVASIKLLYRFGVSPSRLARAYRQLG
jgi:rSAM/selenodomain-associated transferase 2